MRIQEIHTDELSRWCEQRPESVHIVDVREAREYEAGTIPGAVHVPLMSLPFRAVELDGAKRTVVVCRSGVRSAQACAFLASRGVANVYNLRGGMLAWTGSGGPVTTGLPVIQGE